MLFKNGIPAKTPRLLKWLYPRRIWSYPKRKNCIYLTFDDGPTPGVTDWVLDTLKRFDAKATFFCIGKNVAAHENLFHRIHAEGHCIGNHTHNHLNGWKVSTEEYLQNVKMASEYIDSDLFRPPYGRASFKQAKELKKQGFKIIMWDILAMDWKKSISAEACYKNVIENVENGSIIVFHDSIKAGKNLKRVLTDILRDLQSKGYQFELIPSGS
ncbi:polysaccharide deacetylase family protein [Flavobacteriaceae bacterium M23B6Z8]